MVDRHKIFIRMFKEIIKHSELHDCYYCKNIVKELNLKEKLEEMNKGF